MRKLMKLIVITALTALLFCALITCATADEKIYTSPTFTLPTDRLILAEEIFDAQEAANQPEEPEEIGEELPEEGEALPTEGEELPETGEELLEEGEPVPTEGEELPETGEELPEEGKALPAEGEQIPEAEEEIPENSEELPEADEEPDEDEDVEALDEDAGEVIEEPIIQRREVIIRSSQGEIVTEGEVITLRSELRGFGDDEQVTYQWQVDRGEGNGWEDVEGATKDKHVFIADRTTIRYSWRLIVNVIEE